MTRCILIAGPTAAGKTDLSLHAAGLSDGEIVNADSMQVYDGLQVITARPGLAETRRFPHHLFGTIDPSERFSVGAWCDVVTDLIADVQSRGRTPVIVGGTGLYFLALTKGLAPVPAVDAQSRSRVEVLIEKGGVDALRAEALHLDPDAAQRVEAADRQRLQRIVEVAYATGETLSSFQKDTVPLIPADSWTGIVLAPDREALYARIDRRFDAMLEAGALEEVERFAERGLAPDLPAMKALGVPSLMAHLRGECALEAAVEDAKRESRRYAKRQMTWFRNQHADWHRIDPLDPGKAGQALSEIVEGGAA